MLQQKLNFTGFRKILKKFDKMMKTEKGAEFRVAKVESAPFYNSKHIDNLILETEVRISWTRFKTKRRDWANPA